MRKYLLLLLLLCLLPSAYSWTGYTHRWICEKAGLSYLDCANADYKDMQSKYHDLTPVHHHCTNGTDDCAAKVYAEKFLALNTTESRGFAAHLYADSMVPVHWYSTDYNTCHKIFEDKVEEKLRNAEDESYMLFNSVTDLSSWNITMKCPAKFGKENRTVILYADDKYMDSVVSYVAGKMDAPIVPVHKKTHDLTPLFYVLLILLILIIVLFIIFGMKNRKDNG